MTRHVFFISDGTGITAEALGNSLISQFEDIQFQSTTLPYINNLEKASDAISQINSAYDTTGEQPLVFTTLVDPTIREFFNDQHAHIHDLFQAFLNPIEKQLNAKSTYTVGKSHSVVDSDVYQARIEAVNFALACDDGLGADKYAKADVIVVGVSRSGKTPTSLYLAMQFGVLAANYPLTEDDFDDTHLPKSLRPFRKKIFGLTISSERLQQIRKERKPNSRYASLAQCQMEIARVEQFYRQDHIQFRDTTALSVEEISTYIMSELGLERRVF